MTEPFHKITEWNSDSRNIEDGQITINISEIIVLVLLILKVSLVISFPPFIYSYFVSYNLWGWRGISKERI